MLAAKYRGMIQVFCLEDRAQQRIKRNDKELVLFIEVDDKYKEQAM